MVFLDNVFTRLSPWRLTYSAAPLMFNPALTRSLHLRFKSPRLLQVSATFAHLLSSLAKCACAQIVLAQGGWVHQAGWTVHEVRFWDISLD